MLLLIGSNIPSISYGAEFDATAVNSLNSKETPVVFMDSNAAILCFHDETASDRPSMVELSISGTTITAAGSVELFDVYGEFIEGALALSSTELLVAYTGTFGGTHLAKYTIASHVPTYDWFASYGGGTDLENNSIGLFNGTYAFTFYNRSTTDLNCRVVTIADGTLGTEATISGGGDVLAPPVMFDDTYALIVYGKTATMYATIATRSGTTISGFDTPQSISVDMNIDSKWVWAEKVNSTTAKIYYRPYSDYDIYVVTATNNGDGTLTLSSPSKLRTVTDTTGDAVTATLRSVNMGRFNSLLIYPDFDDGNYIKARTCIDVVEYNPVTIKSFSSRLLSIDKLDDNTAIIGYNEQGSSKPVLTKIIKLT